MKYSQTTMAALRRFMALVNKKTNISNAAGQFLRENEGLTENSTVKRVVTGLCVALGGAAVYHYCTAPVRAPRDSETQRFGAAVSPFPVVYAKTRKLDDEEDMSMSAHEQRFRLFSSLEFAGQLFMSPLDFIESVTVRDPKKKKFWRSLTKQEIEQILSDTPPVWKGSSCLFRNLQDKGIITYTEYLFLLCILTKPHAGFKVAFNMFDADGNEMVDKQEFMVLEEIFRKKNDKKERETDSAQLVLRKEPSHFAPQSLWEVLRHCARVALFSDLAEGGVSGTDTTLLVHFFGKRGKTELTFDDFSRFMDNLQTELLEIEFLTYSGGMTSISEEDFARILLRYTTVDNINSYLESVRQSVPDEKGITFDEFRCFFQFLNNLEDFAIAMQMYNFANRSIGQDEFARAVYVATGHRLTRHLVNTIFKIFDVDHDDQLSYQEFIGIMKDRLQRGSWGHHSEQSFTSFKACMRKELSGR